MSRFPTRFQQKTLWNAATGVAILVLGALVVGFTWLLGQVFGFLQPVLIPLIIAGVIAYLLDPVVVWLERRRMKRVWAVVVVFLGLLLVCVGMTAALMPGIARGKLALQKIMPGGAGDGAQAAADDDDKHLIPQLAASIAKLRDEHASDPIGWALTEVDDQGEPVARPKPVPPAPTPVPAPAPAPTPTPAPGTVPAVEGGTTVIGGGSPAAAAAAEEASLEFLADTRIGRMLFKNRDTILSTGRQWLSVGTSKIFGFLGLVLGMIMVPVYLFFFLKESAGIRDHWHDYVPLKASRFKTELVDCLREINGYLISFFRGQVLVALIDGVLVGIALTIFGLPYGLLVGAFMAVLGVIPYIGNILCLVPACIIGYLHAQGLQETGTAPWGLTPVGYVVGVVAIFVGVQQINSLVTAPKIVGDSVGLHPLTVIFSMLFWSLVLGGFVGALLAVPLTAAVKVLFRRYIWERQLREDLERVDDPRRMFDD